VSGSRSPLRTFLLALLIAGLLALPLVWDGDGVLRSVSAESPRSQISFTPHITPLVIEPTPGPLPLATISAGQTFTSDSKPELANLHGDDLFGWGDILGEPGLVLIWASDENGTHYLVVDKTSDLFLGFRDPAGGRLDDGFEDFVEQRTAKLEEIRSAENEIHRHEDLRWTSHGTGLIIAGVGGLVCALLTGGACLAAAGLAAIAAWGNGARENVEAGSAERVRKQYLGDLKVIEGNIAGTYEQIFLAATSP